MRTLPLILLLCTCVSALMHAQNLPRIDYFTVNDGLSARDINDLYIGHDGFLWVATTDGLNRFDGQGFTRFGAGPEGYKTSGRSISRIAVDSQGVFILTFRNFYGYFDRFDPNSKRVEQIQLVPSTGVLGYPRAIATDAKGQVFVVTIGAEGTILYAHRPHGERPAEQFTAVYHEPADSFSTLAPRVALLVLRDGGFLLYDDAHGFRHLNAEGALLSQPFTETARQRRFYTFAEAPDGRVYFSFRDGYPLFSWNPGSTTPPTPVPGLDDKLRLPTVAKDKSGQLLFQATEDFLGDAFPEAYYLVDTSGRFQLYEKDMPTNRAVTAATALNFNQTTYVGLQEGLGVIERYTNSVRTYLTARATDKLGRNVLGGICEDTSGNIYVIEQDGFIYAFPAGQARADTLHLWVAEGSSQVVSFRGGADLAYDEARNVLWATALPLNRNRGGLLIRHDLTGGYTQTFQSPYALGPLQVGPTGKIYVGASDARRIGLLLEFDPDSGRYNQLREAEGSSFELTGLRINDLEWVDGRLLLATEDLGLLRYHPTTGLVDQVVASDDGLSGPAKLNEIHTVLKRGGNYWLGTDAGLRQVDTAGRELASFDRQDGLSSNVVYGILPDAKGGLWISTANGLTHLPGTFDPDDFRRYYREDGLASNEGAPLSFFLSSDGRYFFGSTNGLTVFREGDFSPQATGADVMITEVEVFGRDKVRTIDTNLSDLEEVTVFASEKSVAISFALPAGQLPSSTQFRYQLEGFNDDWVALTNERTIRFNNLGGGSYTLRIQGAGANGNFGEQEKRLRITVRQYIFEKLWFQGLIVMSFALLVFGLLQTKHRERLRNEQLRTQLSSDIHDEVSGLLAGISLQAELLKSRVSDARTQEKLENVGQAARSAMSKMSDVIWSIDSRRDTIGNLLQRMQEHADQVLLPIDIRYEFSATDLDEGKKLSGNIRQDLYFIFKEAINNIARHSNATRVEINLRQPGAMFELSIRDNGNKGGGLPGAADAGAGEKMSSRVKRQKSGQGKDNMRMRAARLRGEISIDDDRGYTLVLSMHRL